MNATETGAATPYRRIFEQLAAGAEQHLAAIERICERGWELREQMLEELCPEAHDDEVDRDGKIAEAYDTAYGFNLLIPALEAVGQ